MRQWLNDLSIKKKIIFYSYLVVTPILFLISALLFVHNYRDMKQRQNDEGQSRVQNLTNNFQEMQQSVEELSLYLCINTQVEKLLTAQNPEELNKNTKIWLDEAPMQFIEDTLALKGYIKTLGIYPENGLQPYLRCLDFTSYLPTIEQVRETEHYQRAVKARGKKFWQYVSKTESTFYQANRSDKLVLYREIYDLTKKHKRGYLVIGADAEKFQNLCDATLQLEEEGLLVLNAQGEPLIQSGALTEDTFQYLTEGAFLEEHYGNEVRQFHLGKQTVYWNQNEKDGIIVCDVIPDSYITGQLLSVAYAPLLLLLGFLLGLFPVLNLVSNIVTRPLAKVEQAMRHFRRGDFGQRVEVETRDEMGQVALCFNQMVTDIKELIDQNYVMELREKESELIALQAQINPHFLYNTLDSLYWQAQDAGNEEIAENILTLSNLFRLVLGEGKGIIRVRQERDLIQEYLKIQKMRFTKRLDYEIEMDQEILDETIPKLILQPFVENAVVHGFENTDRPCRLYVGGKKLSDGMEFIIRDTGVGMTKEQVKAMFAVDDAERYKGQRIGRYAVKNVKERLELKYHDRFSLQVESAPNEGTIIRLVIHTN